MDGPLDQPGSDVVRLASAPIVRGSTLTSSRQRIARIARSALIAAVDVASLVAAAAAAYLIWALPMLGQSSLLYVRLAPLTALFLLGYAAFGLYPGFGLGPVETLRRSTYATTLAFLLLAAFSFALKLPPLYSRVTFTLAFLLSLISVPIGRAMMSRLASRWEWWSEPVVVIGTGDRAASAIRSMEKAHRKDYRPVAILNSEGVEARTEIDSVPIVGGLDCAPRLAALGVRVALLETDRTLSRALVDRLQRHFRHVVLFRESDGLPVEGLQVRHLGDLLGIEYTNNLLMHGNRVAKRALDLIVGTLALVAVAPFIGCAVAIVRLLDGGPVFFWQERAGLDGRRIGVPKIRTMRRDAEKRLEEYLAANPALRQEWDTRFKLADDPRLLPVIGRLFRRFSIDELPQLLTVVTGQMSMVGPRPFPDYHMRHFGPAFVELRQRVRPGITGLWQITVRSAGSTEEQEALDSYYIRNWSVWMDLYILSRTLVAVASGRGAY